MLHFDLSHELHPNVVHCPHIDVANVKLNLQVV